MKYSWKKLVVMILKMVITALSAGAGAYSAISM